MGSIKELNVTLLAACLLCLSFTRTVAQAAPTIANRADTVLHAASEYLASAAHFTLRAEVWRERVSETGEKLQFARIVTLEVQRPDRLHMSIHSGHVDRGFWYDGRSLAILDRQQNLYSRTSMPPNLDAALDAAHDQFGIDVPLVDLAISDPYRNAVSRVQSGRYFGISTALGFQCHHLAFTQDNVDWQLWVEDGPEPLIRKLVINHKNDPGSPEFTALITNWDFTGRISPTNFAFEPPPGASELQMRPLTNSSSVSNNQVTGTKE
jgi:hypothetical protein